MSPIRRSTQRLDLIDDLAVPKDLRYLLQIDSVVGDLANPEFFTFLAVVALVGNDSHGMTSATRREIGDRRGDWCKRGSSDASIKRHLGRLGEAGLIARFREKGLNGKDHPVTVVYTVLLLRVGRARQALSLEARDLLQGWRSPFRSSPGDAWFLGPYRNPRSRTGAKRKVRFSSLVRLRRRSGAKEVPHAEAPADTSLVGHLGVPVTRQNSIQQSGEGEEGRFRADAAVCSNQPGADSLEVNDSEGLETALSSPTVGGDSTFSLQALCAHRRPQGGTKGSQLLGEEGAA